MTVLSRTKLAKVPAQQSVDTRNEQTGWPNSSSANSAFRRFTSTWSNGALVFMAQSRRVVTMTKPQPGISTGNRRHGSPQFCRLP
jgi:hypothetical protein